MRRGRGLKRGRVAAILLAGTVGYLAGNWHAVSLRSGDASPTLSPAQNVALRFPMVQADAATDSAPEPTSATSPANATGAASAMVLDGAQFALLSPQPLAGSLPTRPEPQAVLPAVATPQPRATVQRRNEVRAPAESAVRRANRPGFMLNDAQIASIRERLHLTPDQDRMWPSVEAALRTIAYAKAHDANRRGAATVAVASLDPDSAEVQDLKSAAIPLLMSFNDEQKNEVRSLAHVMGLDRLAAEF